MQDDNRLEDSGAVAQLLEAVRNQIAQGDPQEAAAACQRLQERGYSEDEAIRLIALALEDAVSEMLKHDQPFDRAGYVAALERLPEE